MKARIVLIFGALAGLYAALYLLVERVDRTSMLELAHLRQEAGQARLAWNGDLEGLGVEVVEGRVVAPVPEGRAFVPGYLGHGAGEGVFWTLLLFGMVVLGSELAARELARPLRELAEGAERLAEGRPGPPLTEGPDEFGQLAATFNRMSALIARRDAELKAEHEAMERAALLKSRLLEQSYADMRETLAAMHPEDAAMERNLQSMRGLVEDLQQAAWLEQGRLQVELRAVDLSEQVALVRELMAPQLEARGLALEEQLGAVPSLQADPERLRQILLNLLGNAVKFTPDGVLQLRAHQAGEEVVVELEDGGPGIAPEALPRVFEEFRQAHEGIHRQFGGTGLGLSISRRLAELQGGRLELESQPGRGTVARLVLRVSS